MRRRHVFEFVDQPWLPEVLREGSLEVLSLALSRGVYDGVAPAFERFLLRTGAERLLDLGSGGGGPTRALLESYAAAGRTPPRVVLSDLFPNLAAFERAAAEDPRVEFCAEPVSAAEVPPEHAALPRLLCTVFHHFPPALAQQVLSDAAARAPGIFIVEPLERNPLRYLPMIVRGLPSFVESPFRSPRQRLAKAFFSFVLPLIPAVLAWDGTVSALRMYSEEELMAMAARTGAEDYDWEYGTAPFAPLGRVTWFAGVRR